MSAEIGGVSLISIKGRVAKLGEGIEDITRPGIDGHSYKKIGTRAPVVTLETLVDVSSAGNAEGHIDACVALKGSLVTVKYTDGSNDEHVAVLDVEPVRVKQVKTPVGGVNGGSWLVTMRWQMQKAASD